MNTIIPLGGAGGEGGPIIVRNTNRHTAIPNNTKNTSKNTSNGTKNTIKPTNHAILGKGSYGIVFSPALPNIVNGINTEFPNNVTKMFFYKK